jgi:hypothetical protein
MSSLYDIDFNQQAIDLLPPDKRNPKNISLFQALMNGIQWCRDLILGSYKTGAIAPNYSPGTYNIYDQVVYKQKVFESLKSGNTDTPDVITSWRLIQNNFIGVDERVLFNGGLLILTYALNKWFMTTFRQPPALSDIYIITNVIPVPVFRVGIEEIQCSDVYSNTSSEFVYNNYNFADINSFTIYVPIAVYNALSSIPANRDAVIRNFADKYVIAGLFYNIQTY